MPRQKATKKKIKVIKKPKEPKKSKYFEAVGRRKTAKARVRIFEAKGGSFIVNEKPLEKYFSVSEMQKIALSPLEGLDLLAKFGVSAKVKGGGIHAQAEAVRHGIAKALTVFDAELRKSLAKIGYLTRDPRMRERKKFGLKRARKAPQWQKR